MKNKNLPLGIYFLKTVNLNLQYLLSYDPISPNKKTGLGNYTTNL